MVGYLRQTICVFQLLSRAFARKHKRNHIFLNMDACFMVECWKFLVHKIDCIVVVVLFCDKDALCGVLAVHNHLNLLKWFVPIWSFALMAEWIIHQKTVCGVVLCIYHMCVQNAQFAFFHSDLSCIVQVLVLYSNQLWTLFCSDAMIPSIQWEHSEMLFGVINQWLLPCLIVGVTPKCECACLNGLVFVTWLSLMLMHGARLNFNMWGDIPIVIVWLATSVGGWEIHSWIVSTRWLLFVHCGCGQSD